MEKTSLHLMIGSLVFSSITIVDIVMLEILGKNENEVGYFVAILSLTHIFSLIGSSMNNLIEPITHVGANKPEKRKLFQHILNIGNGIKLFISLIFLISILVFSKELIVFFSKSFPFVDIKIPMFVIIISFFISNVLGTARSVLMYSGHEKINIVIALLKLVLLIILNVILIPKYELLGVSISIACAYILGSITEIIYCNFRTGFKSIFLY